MKIHKTNVGIRTKQNRQNRQLGIFLPQISLKRKLGFEIQKNNFGIRISILDIPCVPIFRQNRQLSIFGPILRSKCQKSKSGFGISILEILRVPIFRKTENFEFLGPNLPKNKFLGSEFQKSKSGFGISTSNLPCVPTFSQNGQLLIFWPKFGEIAQLRAIFWFKNCWGCCRELGEG